MKDEKWAFTFGYGDEEKRNKYVVFEGNWAEARAEMNKEFGKKWAFQYPWEAFQLQIKDFDLTELESEEPVDFLKDVPFIAVGANELGEQLGKTITCPQCSQEHDISTGTVKNEKGEMVPSDLLQFYKCGDASYLAGIKGQKFK